MSSISMYPVRIEACCDVTKDMLFVVETVDECAAKVELKTCVNVAEWDRIAPMVRDALVLLQLESTGAAEA